MPKWRWYAVYDIDGDPLEDTIEGVVEASNEEEAVARVRAGEGASGTPYPFDDFWSVWVEAADA